MKRLLLLLLFALFQTAVWSQPGFHFYEENGLWGVKYNGEPCLLPRFEQVAGLEELRKMDYKEDNGNASFHRWPWKTIMVPKRNELCTFFYKRDGKWGIANVWEEVGAPFADSLAIPKALPHKDPAPGLFLFLQDGRWGLCNMMGETLVPAVFQDTDITIIDVHNEYIKNPIHYSNKTKSSYKNQPLIFYNTYCYGFVEGCLMLYDITGRTVLTGAPEQKAFASQSILKAEEANSKNDKKDGNILSDKLQAIQERRMEAYHTHTLVWKKFNTYPYKIYFGQRGDQPIEPQGDSATVAGLPCIVNDFGFISMPLEYSSLPDRLERNPLDVYALCDQLDEEVGAFFRNKSNQSYNSTSVEERKVKFFQKKADEYWSLLPLVDQEADPYTYNYVFGVYNEAINRAAEAQERIGTIEARRQRREETLRGLMSLGNSLSTAASILSRSNTSGATSSYSARSYSGTSGSVSTASASTSQMSGTDMQNYNTMRNTYNKWAQDLMQMKNANGKYQNGYSATDKQHAQSEMKRIRTSAKQKWGKDIPYNSMEDW